MKIAVKPSLYTAVYTPVIYRIDEVNTTRVLEVTIMGRYGETLGVKHFRAETNYAVNVAGYAGKEMDVKPIYALNSGFYMIPSRTTEVSIVAKYFGLYPETVSSEPQTLVAAWEPISMLKQLAKGRKITTISDGDIDEISFIAPQKLVAAVVTLTGKSGGEKIAVAKIMNSAQNTQTGYACGEGVCSFIVNMDSVAAMTQVRSMSEYSRMSVEVKIVASGTSGKPIDVATIESSASTIARREYDILPANPNVVRVCWLNRQSGVDYYSFRGERAQKLMVDKSKVYTSHGYKTLSSQAETMELLRSEYEPEQTIEWLSDIVASSKVWRVEGAKYTPIDVVSSSVETKNSAPISISIVVREVKKRNF